MLLDKRQSEIILSVKGRKKAALKIKFQIQTLFTTDLCGKETQTLSKKGFYFLIANSKHHTFFHFHINIATALANNSISSYFQLFKL